MTIDHWKVQLRGVILGEVREAGPERLRAGIPVAAGDEERGLGERAT